MGWGVTSKIFLGHFFVLNTSGKNAIVQRINKITDNIDLSFYAKVLHNCAII